jgi:O-antigen/teichoic acid export membrane protein
MSRTKSFLSGALFSYIYQGAAMVVGLWLTPFFLRTLGTKDFGVWLVGLQVLNFLLLIDFGIIGVVARDVGHASGLEQLEPGSGELGIFLGRTIKVIMVQTVLVGVAALGVFLFRPVAAASLRGPIALVLVVFTLSYPFRLFPVVLQGLQDLKFLGQLRLWLWALATALTVILLLLGARFYALACGWCIQQLGHDLVAYIRLHRIRPDLVTMEAFKQAGPIRLRWFARGFWVSVGQAAYTFIAGADLLIVARALGPATVVIYSCTAKLINVLQNQPQMLASVALPGLSHMKTSESRERILSVTTSLTQAILLLVGAVFCVVLSVNRQFVTLWVGPSFFAGMLVTGLMIVNFLLRQIDSTLAIALFALGYEKLGAIRCLVDGVVSVALASILAGRFGMPGVVAGFLCGALFVSIPMDLFLVTREFKISVLQAARPYTPYLWRIAVIGGGGLALMMRLEAPSIFNLAAVTLLVALAYAALVFPYVWHTPLREYIQSAVISARAGMRSLILGWSNNA